MSGEGRSPARKGSDPAVTLLRALIIVLLLLPASAAAAGAETAVRPAEVESALAAAVRAEQRAQAEVEKWAGARAELLAEISQARKRLKWLKLQNRRHLAYIERRKEAIAEIERRRAELTRIDVELEPFLEETVDRLEAFVEADLGFLPQERAERIAFLRRSLSEYRLGLSEKLRRVVEALIVEAGYGRSVDKIETEIELEGRPVRVDLLRLGRLAEFYRTPDGRRLGWRHRGSNGWIDLPAGLRRNISRAMDIAARRRAVELVDLPVARPVK